MLVRVEPTTLTLPVPLSEIPTSPPPTLLLPVCTPHATPARDGAHPHRFPTMGTPGAAEGYADTVTEQRTTAGCVHGRRAKHKEATELRTALPRTNELLGDAGRVR
jgi:hypothetical protein